MIDIHTHILPGMDDGARDVRESLAMIDLLKKQGLDALIITGANPAAQHLEDEPFWDGLCEVVAWAKENVTSTLCSCLASHALVLLNI